MVPLRAVVDHFYDLGYEKWRLRRCHFSVALCFHDVLVPALYPIARLLELLVNLLDFDVAVQCGFLMFVAAIDGAPCC